MISVQLVTGAKIHFRWGAEMYDWHAQHPEKGDRFCRAMRGVSKCKLATGILQILQPAGKSPLRIC